MRASQLDAGRLDTELTAMLREQFMRIFSLFQPVSPLSVPWHAHITMLVLFHAHARGHPVAATVTGASAARIC